MSLNKQLQAVCENFFMDLKRNDDEQTQIYYTVLYYIHSAPHLSRLYLNWTNLKVYEKLILNNQMKRSLIKTGKLIYPPVIRALEYWDMVQDAYGAPGFSCNPLQDELREEIDREIVKMIIIMEKTINQIDKKRKVMQELSSYKETRNILYSYKWRIICKNINKKRSYLTNRKQNENDEENASDLNGCGDTSWFSDTD